MLMLGLGQSLNGYWFLLPDWILFVVFLLFGGNVTEAP